MNCQILPWIIEIKVMLLEISSRKIGGSSEIIHKFLAGSFLRSVSVGTFNKIQRSESKTGSVALNLTAEPVITAQSVLHKIGEQDGMR